MILLAFAVAFRWELLTLLKSIWGLRLLLVLRLPDMPFLDLVKVFGALVFFVLSFGFGLVLSARAVLPARTMRERISSLIRMLMYGLRMRGPAITIRDGRQVTNPEETWRPFPGVVFVDPVSAVVLERQYPKWMWWPDSGSATARVQGPGITFTGFFERVRGTVDLRRQFRIALGLPAYTSDGIEVKTNTFVLFSVSEPPDVYRVGLAHNDWDHAGALTADNVCVFKIDERSQEILDVQFNLLSLEDRREIFDFIQRFPWRYVPLGSLPKPPLFPPYPIEGRGERIFKAIYSRGYKVVSGGHEDWADLPPQVATETLRNMLAKWKYDDLYEPLIPGVYPLKDKFKPEFATAIRNQGVLSYQAIVRYDRRPLAKGEFINEVDHFVSEVQPLTNFQVLRNRGIKVIHAGFSELKPVDPAVKSQRLENWRARWQSDAETTRADYDLEVMRIRNRARAQSMREMTYSLTHIFESTPLSQEAMAVRLFQALEAASADPQTRKLLPADTINMLRNLRVWLLSDEDGIRPLIE